MAKELSVLVSEEIVGTISEGEAGKLRFRYDEGWRNRIDAHPLSLSMPLPLAEHSGKAVPNFLWGLLPDNSEAVSDLARKFGVSRNNPFALIAHIGEDLAGAVQMIPPDRVASLEKRKGVVPISETRLAQFLDELVRHPGQTQITDDAGFFSLAGFQPKKALCWLNGKWYEPRGRTSSTHILKPPMAHLDGQIENEHFCQALAARVGLAAARTRLVEIAGKRNLLIERYDRVRVDGVRELRLGQSGGVVVRVHQEDLCQALAFHPSQKYQHDGGPGVSAAMKLFEGSGDPNADRRRFMRALAFNFIIAGIDAHAKNYSLLHEPGGRFRLAPLYDLISALPYDVERYSSLAMSIGGERQWRRITPWHWERAAKACKYAPETMLEDVHDLIASTPEAAEAVLRSSENGEGGEAVTALARHIQERCEELRAEFA